MNILWIEDFSRDVPDHKALGENLFKDLINKGKRFGVFDNSDGDFHINFPKYFKEKSKGVQKLTICLTLDEFENKYEGKILDYDIFIIDINLSEGSLGDPEISKWHGFGIYNRIVRKGIPEPHTAIMTGNADKIRDVCKKHSLPEPTNFFKKGEINKNTEFYPENPIRGYSECRRWLQEKADDPFIQLRRGILDSCEELKTLESQNILLNNVIRKFNDEPEEQLDWEYGEKFLDRMHQLFIKEFYFENDSKKGKYRLYIYLLALTSEWDRTGLSSYLFLKDYNDEKYTKYKSWSKEQKELQKIAFWILKNSRNCLAHSTFTADLDPSDLAFFYLLAMRNFFDMDPEKVYDYEKILLHIIKISIEDRRIFEKELTGKSKIYEDTIRRLMMDIFKTEVKLSKSQEKLSEDEKDQLKNDFVQLCFAFLESSKSSKQNNNNEQNPLSKAKENVKKYSLLIFYSCFLNPKLFASRRNHRGILKLTHIMSGFACKKLEKDLERFTSADISPPDPLPQ
ncbi:MAG: hypothetical protein JJT78_18400 [Leptospira sp.]|nr:hypothetical protein [Leptospira sp.]